ncbi:MAG: filamentous hemagglutinin N-terminal domain-containing protein, partial [Methylomonas sp.]
MNKTFRSIWNSKKQTYVAVAEIVSTGGKRTSSSVALVVSPLLSLVLAGSAWAADLPTGGQIIGGNGSITTNGNSMTINQSTSKMAVDWQSFSIGQNKTVEFVQPSSSAVALNRILGTDVSVIQGALKSNGQVFLINPNGVMFSKGAQVNVGSLVASTLNIKTEDFMAGNYHFEGASSNAIINQGNITADSAGTVALIAAKITNTGQINADAGNVLIGAGSKVKLDLGGPIKIEVEQGAIDALIEQGGGIRADGGLVYLTAKAVGQITSTVINHTGITEAKTLATGEKGQIVLMGGMSKDRIMVGGKLDASAPNGGDGGFIETSSAHVSFNKDLQITTAAPYGKMGTWLIDPVDFTIAASGGDLTGSQLSSALQAANVTIDTTAAATQVYSADNSLTGSNGNGDIFVKDTITPNLTALRTLTLKAGGAINFGSGVSGEEGIITATGNKLNVYLSAGNDGSSNGVTFNTGSSVTTNGGDLLIGGQLG